MPTPRDTLPTARLSAADRAALAVAAERWGTLADVLAWAFAHKPPFEVADVVVQDEFTHDVVLRLGEAAWLVLDTT